MDPALVTKLEDIARRIDSVEGRQADHSETVSELAHSVIDFHRRLADLERKAAE